MDMRTQRILTRTLKPCYAPCTTSPKSAEVVQVIGDTAYVRLYEGEPAIPIDASLVTMSEGDVVRLCVGHDGIEATANETSPAASVTHVNQVIEHKQSEQYKRIEAEFLKADSIEAVSAQIKRLKAEFAEVGDLDVTGILTIKGTIRQLDQSLTEAMNGIWGHYETATSTLKDDDGNDVLDEDGNPIPVTVKVWVTDAAVIADRLQSDPTAYTGLAYNEYRLAEAHQSLREKVGVIESGVHISDDPDDPYITIGKEGDKAALALTNGVVELSAEDEFGNVRHAFRVTPEATVAERLEATNYMKVGRFALMPRLDGALTLQYVG